MDNKAIYDYFMSINEPYAAGLFEAPDKGYFYRHARALARWFNTIGPVSYTPGETLYPCGNKYFREAVWEAACRPQYCLTYEIDWNKLEEKCASPEADEALKALHAFRDISYSPFGWLHGAPNYTRIVKEGFASYRDRVQAIVPENTEEEEFREGLLYVLDAMKNYAGRCREYLISVNAPTELTDALARVPFYPARTYYEGLVAWNTVFYFDGCDNLGCLDQGLAPLYDGTDQTEVIAQLFDNIDSVNQWSCTVGGDGYNEITRQALKAIRGKRRPMLELKVRPDMPEDIWQTAFDNLKAGSSNPSFYSDKGIHDMLKTRFPQMTEDELKRFCGCGCTETNLEGITFAGGTDDDVNLLKIFENYLYDDLAAKETFEDFFEGMCAAAVKKTEEKLDAIDKLYAYRAKYLPSVMRSILFDDCIDKVKPFNAGGARYSWTMNSESGLINVIDSLAAVRKLYYEDKKYTAEEFISLLKAEDADFFAELKTCPCFGTDNEAVDNMGAEFARRVFTVYRTKKPETAFLDGFTLTEHQFLRYEGCGACVGATPDGRHKGQPTCDSMAAVRGKAIEGPTAMLRSAARLPQNMVDGISVVNLTLAKSSFDSMPVMRGIVLGYFALGGIQVQLTVTSAEELKAALKDPEKHGDLLVRVGGYSDYFKNLSPALRQTVVERNIHEL